MKQRKKALQVRLHVREQSVMELTVNERVQLDRLIASARGSIAERHGDLLEPGATTLALGQGHFFFKTLSDAQLRVVQGGITVAGVRADPKNPWPLIDPGGGGDGPAAKGDDLPGQTPRLVVL